MSQYKKSLPALATTHKRLAIGNALISALFIMVLITITSIAIIQRLRVEIAQTDGFIRADKRYLAAQAVPFWAMNELETSSVNFVQNQDDGAVLIFPEKMKQLYPQTKIEGRVYDLQARFNLNGLTQPSAEKIFLTLIQNLQPPDMTENQVKMIVKATKSWISPETGYHQDPWSQYYHSLTPPYQSAHQPMKSPSEFLLIVGVNEQFYQFISPYITTLPEIVAINLNTAPKEIIQAMNPKLSPQQLSEFISFRIANPITNQAKFAEITQRYRFSTEASTFQSRYFLCQTRVVQGTSILTMFSVLKRIPIAPDKWKIQIIQESTYHW